MRYRAIMFKFSIIMFSLSYRTNNMVEFTADVEAERNYYLLKDVIKRIVDKFVSLANSC